jgi:ribosomal protein S18 acetylase RimI-like enzyme
LEANTAVGGWLQQFPAGQSRDEFLPLLKLADDSEQQVRSYCGQGDLYVLRDSSGGVDGIALVVPTARSAAEIKAFAVAEARQRRGLGRRMLALLLDALRRDGVHYVVVGTATSSVGAIAFYQRAGFRCSSVERDFFTVERGYRPDAAEGGIPVRDMIWMDQWL